MMNEITTKELIALFLTIHGVEVDSDEITITSQGLSVSFSLGNIKGVKMNPSPLCMGDFEINTNLPNFTINYYKDDGFRVDLT